MRADSETLRSDTIINGSIWKGILAFFLPILFSNFFQQFYSVVDAAIVGRVLGDGALAAIDSTWSLFRIPTTFFIGVASGATILLSQSFGAGRYRHCNALINTAVGAAAVFGVLLSAVTVVICPWLLQLIQIPDEIFSFALTYARFYSAGLFLVLLFNIGCAILRALGDSKRPFYYLVCSSLLNTVLDLIFVMGFDWGIAGAAVATVLSQGVSLVLVARALVRSKGSIRFRFQEMRFDRHVFRKILQTGFPVGLQSMLYPIANTLIQRSLNGFGTEIIAAWAINGKLDFVLWLVIDSFAISCSTFAAQNYGAQKYDRVRRSISVTLAMACVIVAALSAVFYYGTETFGRIFLDDSPSTIHLAEELMQFIAPWYITAMFGEVLAAAIRATGRTVMSMSITLLSSCAVRGVWIVFITPLAPGPYMTLAVFPVSWITCSLAFLVYYWLIRTKLDTPPAHRSFSVK